MGRIFSIDFGSSIVSEELYGSLPNQFIDGVYWTTKRIFETVMFDTWLQNKQVQNFYEMLHRIINLHSVLSLNMPYNFFSMNQKDL